MISDASPDFFPPGSRVAQGRLRRLQEFGRSLLDLLPRAKPKKPDFLEKRPTPGRLTGDIKELKPEERAFAEEMRDLGNNIEVIPRGTARTPDFRLNGKEIEYKHVSGIRRQDSDGISSAISNRVMNGRGQARDIVVDARMQPGMTEDFAQRAIERAFGADTKRGIDSITILTRDGPVYVLRR